MSMDGIEDMRNIHSMSMSNSTQCRPSPTFDHMEMISAYAGLVIMFIMVIYSRYVYGLEYKDSQKHERERESERLTQYYFTFNFVLRINPYLSEDNSQTLVGVVVSHMYIYACTYLN